MRLDFPYHFDASDRTARTDDEDHIRDLIEQVLFTMPGERVNRPNFGSGVMQLVFAPNSDELASTVEFLVRGALQEFLAGLITVESLQVSSEEATLRVQIDYVVNRTGERSSDSFTQGIAAP